MLLLIGTDCKVGAVFARANNMTEEPNAVVPHVRIWVGTVG